MTQASSGLASSGGRRGAASGWLRLELHYPVHGFKIPACAGKKLSKRAGLEVACLFGAAPPVRRASCTALVARALGACEPARAVRVLAARTHAQEQQKSLLARSWFARTVSTCICNLLRQSETIIVYHLVVPQSSCLHLWL